MLTEKQCIKKGGHCFVGTGETRTHPPIRYVQQCKHCNKELLVEGRREADV